MCRNWKKMSALGLAVLLGCMLPMGTMLAAEEDAGTVQETGINSDFDGDEIRDGETILEDEKDTEEGKDDNENLPDQDNPDQNEEDADDGEAAEEADADEEENDGDEVNCDQNEEESDVTEITPQIKQNVSAKAAETRASVGAPEIVITSGGQSQTFELGGEITYEYVNHTGRSFDVAVSRDGQQVSFSYYLKKDSGKEALEEEQMDDSLTWVEAVSSPASVLLSDNGSYVLYVKAEEDGNVVYKRSGGIVVDIQAPQVIDLVDGNTYPEGTIFQIKDANLESVIINDQSVALSEDGKYQVTAKGNSTSCVIKAKDKAGNETSCSISVSGKNPAGNTISQSGIYSLKAGTAYQLAGGIWSVGGSRTVYQGGSSFYVKADGDYAFWKNVL
ncbi:hypothetical protein D7V83_16045 [bacterium 0.1xD8-71]|nr:hypothetical protein D7V83_16045 [bacterium 0.1xD8-71]